MLASVVVPVFNHRRFVADALWSVHAQTARPGTDRRRRRLTDGSPAWSRNWPDPPASCLPLHFVANATNGGAAATSSREAGAGPGPVLAILNSDDLYRPRLLAR
jgi:hypothetical protein